MSPLNISRRQWLLMKDKRSLSFLTRVLWFSTNQGQEGEAMAPLPPPIRVGFTENAGRGIFATRKISLGDLIHKAQPVVAHPSPAYLHKVCYFCLKCVGMRTSASSWRSMSNEEISLLHEPITAHYACNESSPGSSGLDRSFRFCSVECEEHSKGFFEIEKRADWSTFDEHCRMNGLKYPFLVKRLACMVLSGAEPADCLDILQPASLSPGMIARMEEEFELLRCTFMEAGFKDEKIAILTKQWYVGVLARIRINAFRIELAGGISGDLLSMAAASVLAEAAVGNAVYILPSFYNHDCDPNVHILWLEDVNARLKALRDIEAGEELRICYIDASMSHNARQSILYEGFGFRCHCFQCMSGN
ncbi:hypothetical protein AMTRI_Chr03g140810 [Amborella trichopoda]